MRNQFFALTLLLTFFHLVESFPNYDNPRTANPPLARPTSSSCTVTLIEDANCTSYGEITRIPYTPPSCLSPNMNMAVLDFYGSVAGVQFDRYGALWLGGFELLRLTTPEPSPDGISWHVEKDVTDYAQIFSQHGQNATLTIPNVVDGTYTGVIQITAQVTFYSDKHAIHDNDRQKLPNVMYLNDPTADGGNPWNVMQIQGNQTRSFNVKFPMRNMQEIYLDVYASGHQDEEFWYTNPPDSFAEKYKLPGGGAYREIQIYIDGIFAGSQYPFPVVYTGGYNPLLWRPLTGILSFDIPQYRFDVTPFAALLNDGKSHVVEVTVYDDDKVGLWYIDPQFVSYSNLKHHVLSGQLVKSHNNYTPQVNVVGQNITEPTPGVKFTTKATADYSITGKLYLNDETVISTVRAWRSAFNQNQIMNSGNSQTTEGEMNQVILTQTEFTKAGDLLQRWSHSDYPYSANNYFAQNNSTMEIDTGVSVKRVRKEVFIRTGKMKPKTEFSVEWENYIESEAVYNRSLSSHAEIYKQHAKTDEGFQIRNSEDKQCYDRSMQARNGHIFHDIGNYTCTWPDALKFCGQDVCGHWQGNGRRNQDKWFFWDYSRNDRYLMDEVANVEIDSDVGMTFSNPLLRISTEDGN